MLIHQHEKLLDASLRSEATTNRQTKSLIRSKDDIQLKAVDLLTSTRSRVLGQAKDAKSSISKITNFPLLGSHRTQEQIKSKSVEPSTFTGVHDEHDSTKLAVVFRNKKKQFDKFEVHMEEIVIVT